MANPIRRLISAIIELIVRAVFLGSDSWGKHSSLILLTALIVIAIINLRHLDIASLCIVSISVVVLLTMSGHLRLVPYTLILALIPSVWYIVTTLPFTLSIIESLTIGIRVLMTSILLLTYIVSLNPIEISFILSKIGLKSYSIVPPFMWKVTPHILRDMKLALLANELKREGLWRGVAVSFAASQEYIALYEEGLETKIHDINPKFKYSLRAVMIHILLIAINLTYHLVSIHIW